MEPRTLRRLSSRPPRGARRSDDQGADGDGVDRISSLHDDLLLVILARLRCARTAACTSILSRRWRHGLWKRLLELYFLDTPRRVLRAALAQVAVPKVSLLHIAPSWCGDDRQRFSAAGIASLLHHAARLDPVDLKVAVWLKKKDRGVPVELPCFARATSINLDVHRLNLTLPEQGGVFPVLEKLTITGCLVDIGALISRCPRLRVLELNWYRRDDTIMLHSATIEELLLFTHDYTGIRGIDIMAPVLQKFRLSAHMHKDFTMSMSAPMLENVWWRCRCASRLLKIHQSWCLDLLEVKTGESGCIVLALDIQKSRWRWISVLLERNLKEVFPFPKCSVLEICLEKNGHVYAPMVLNLLTICNSIRRLNLRIKNIPGKYDQSCVPNCPCDQPHHWWSQDIFLTGLEEVEIENFRGISHEVDFLKLLLRCASLTKVIVTLEYNVSTSSRGCKETCDLFKAYTSVECYVYCKKGGKKVFYP